MTKPYSERKKFITRLCQTKEWKETRKRLIKDYCEVCGSTKELTLHHYESPFEALLARLGREPTEQEWKDYYLSGEGTATVCKACHLGSHRGYKLCPVCKKKYARVPYDTCFQCAVEQGKIIRCPDCGRYIHPDSQHCHNCDQAQPVELEELNNLVKHQRRMIRELLESEGKTKKELARYISVEDDTVSLFLSCQCNLDEKQLDRIGEFLGIPVEALFLSSFDEDQTR